MKSSSNLIKISGIINSIFGLITIKIPFFGLFLLISGVILYLLSKEEKKLIEYKTPILIFGIISIPFSIISAILLIVASDEIGKYKRNKGINSPPKVIYKVDKEAKKIDLLLKLGVGMIFISGVLFATTSWNFINNSLKAVILLLFGILFISLSLFTEKKLKLYRTSYMYWLLSMAFFILTIIGILYFGIFGTYLTYQGLGKYLSFFITYIVISGLFYTTYLKFSKKYLLFGSYSFLTLSIYFIFVFLKLAPITVLSIISLVVMILNILSSNKSTLFTFSKLLSLLLFIFIIRDISTSSELAISLASLINILNLNCLIIKEPKKDEALLSSIITYILIFIGIMPLKILGNYNILFIAVVTSIYTLLLHKSIIPLENNKKPINYMFYTISIFIAFMISCDKLVIISPVIAIIYIFVNETAKYGLYNTTEISISRYLEPLSVMLLITSIQINILNEVNLIYVFALSSLAYCLLHLLYHNDKKVYFIAALITSIVTIIANNEDTNIFISLITILSSLYLFSTSYIHEHKKITLAIAYVLLLSSIYLPFVAGNTLEIKLIPLVTIFIGIMILFILFLKDEVLNKITLFYITLPLLTLTINSDFTNDVQVILKSVLYLYLTFLIIKFLVKDKIGKNIIGIIGIIVSLVDVFTLNNIYGGIYIGVIGIILIIIGYYYEELSSLFKFGIILTIINIIIQLSDFWELIPFWLYLLAGGLSIIIFVTYIQLQKQNKQKLNNQNEQ